MRIKIELDSQLFDELKRFAEEQGFSAEDAAKEYLQYYLDNTRVSNLPTLNYGRVTSVDFEHGNIELEIDEATFNRLTPIFPTISVSNQIHVNCASISHMRRVDVAKPKYFTDSRASNNFLEWNIPPQNSCRQPIKKKRVCPVRPVYSQPFPLY